MPVETTALPAIEVLDLLPVGVCIIDEEFRILAWNRQLQDWTELHSKDVLETNLAQHFPNILQDRFRLRLQQVFTSRTPVVFTAALHKQFLPVDVRNSNPPRPMIQETRVRWLPGDRPRALIAIHDLTNEYGQLGKLRREHRTLKGMQNDLEQANGLLQSSVTLISQNNQKLQGEIQERRRAEEELRRQTADLQVANEAAAVNAERASRHAAELQATMQELEQARRLAEAAAEAKTEFLANMSHEIRTPMTAILGFVDLLRDHDLPQSERESAIETVHRNGEHLLAIINDILDISKIEAGRMTIERLACSPRELIQDVVELLQARARERGLDLIVKVDPSVPRSITTDPTRLRQILANLVGNALKFTEQGSVTVRAKWHSTGPSTGSLEIAVIDTGIGIKTEHLTRLFRPFSQADSTMSRRFGGTGLGLAICHRLAEMLGGGIAVESREGVGSCFQVALDGSPAINHVPLLPLPQTVANPTGVSGQLSGLRVLVVDDAADNRRLLSHHVQKAGAKCLLAENGLLALEQIAAAHQRGEPFDVVLMDMAMPVLDGYQATSRLRERGDKTPVIALTAHAMSTDEAKCLAYGCDDFQTKPINKHKLIATIARWAGPSARLASDASPQSAARIPLTVVAGPASDHSSPCENCPDHSTCSICLGEQHAACPHTQALPATFSDVTACL